MKDCFAYIRVSTTKQEEGVSLEAQREAISGYAKRNGLTITTWFQESQTAAKRGRNEFTKMLKRLKKEEASGVIIHKIDRSARNLRDWADFAELVDEGIDIHLAAESLDLSSRGGRLSADIQAVVAADYIRNLREETRKGFYGRLNQGLLPFAAPIGYEDNGKGKPKTIDPVKGPLVKEMFERYATGSYTLERICKVMNRLGLRNTVGNPIEKNGASRILNQPFYTGIIKLKSTGEVFEGVHEPLISKRLFDTVQDVLDGNSRPKRYKHAFAFRKLIRCGLCKATMIPERQKGYAYYRCHTKACPTKCFREEQIDKRIQRLVGRLSLSKQEVDDYRRHLAWYVDKRADRDLSGVQALELEAQNVADRLTRLTDLLIDGTVDKEVYDAKKEELVFRKRELESLIEDRKPNALTEQVEWYLEQALDAKISYERASERKKRELVETFTSNRTAKRKEVDVKLRTPFQFLAERQVVASGDPHRDVPRTQAIYNLIEYSEEKLKLISEKKTKRQTLQAPSPPQE